MILKKGISMRSPHSQIEKESEMPDGFARFSFSPRKKEANKAPEPTTMAVTIRAPSSTARASHGRGSS